MKFCLPIPAFQTSIFNLTTVWAKLFDLDLYIWLLYLTDYTSAAFIFYEEMKSTHSKYNGFHANYKYTLKTVSEASDRH